MAQTPPNTAQATVITQDGLNLRANPSTLSPATQMIPFGSVVTLTGSATADHWYPVSYGTLVGWASGDYLAAGSLDPLTAASATPLSASSSRASTDTSPTASTSTTATGAPSTPNADGLRTSSATASTPSTSSAASASSTSANSASYTATATYYGIDDGAKAGQMMACGAPFDPYNIHSAATNDWPCGTKLHVTGPDGRGIDVVVADHGMYPQHWLDLTYAAFGLIADHRTGVIQVSVSVTQ